MNVSATEAKNRLGQVLEQAKAVATLRHDALVLQEALEAVHSGV